MKKLQLDRKKDEFINELICLNEKLVVDIISEYILCYMDKEDFIHIILKKFRFMKKKDIEELKKELNKYLKEYSEEPEYPF
mgnify:CR=1 FL=1